MTTTTDAPTAPPEPTAASCRGTRLAAGAAARTLVASVRCGTARARIDALSANGAPRTAMPAMAAERAAAAGSPPRFFIVT